MSLLPASAALLLPSPPPLSYLLPPPLPSLPFTLHKTFCTFADPLPLSGHGALDLTPTSLIFTLHTLPPTPDTNPTLTIALASIPLSSLTLRTPLFRPPYVSGTSNGIPFTLEGDARLLIVTLRTAVADDARRRRRCRERKEEKDRWVVRMVAAGEERQTGAPVEGVAFFDPESPSRLVLAQKMCSDEILRSAAAMALV